MILLLVLFFLSSTSPFSFKFSFSFSFKLFARLFFYLSTCSFFTQKFIFFYSFLCVYFFIFVYIYFQFSFPNPLPSLFPLSLHFLYIKVFPSFDGSDFFPIFGWFSSSIHRFFLALLPSPPILPPPTCPPHAGSPCPHSYLLQSLKKFLDFFKMPRVSNSIFGYILS